MRAALTKWIAVLLAVFSLCLVADAGRLFVVPIPRVVELETAEVQASVRTSAQYIIRETDCVQVDWSIRGASLVTFNGQRVAPTGSDSYCPATGLRAAQPMTLPADFRPAVREEAGQDVSLTAYFNEGREIVNVRVPVIVLTRDILWMWRIVAAVAAALVAWGLWFQRSPVPDFGRWGMSGVSTWLAIVVLVLIGIRGVQTYIEMTQFAFTPETAGGGISLLQSVGGFAKSFVLTTFYALILAAVGFALVHTSFNTLSSSPVQLGTGFLLGTGIYSLLWIVLGVLGWLTIPMIVIMLLFGGLVSVAVAGRALLAAATETWAILKQGYCRVDASWRVLLILGGVWLLLLALRSIQIPSIDGPITYMLMAKLYAVSHTIQPIRDGSLYYFTLSGHLGEMHMAALYALEGETSARLLTWFMLINVLMMGGAIGYRMKLDSNGIAFLIFMLLTTDALTNLVGDGKVSLYGIAMAVGAIYWVLGEKPVITGLLSGFAVLGSITYGPTLVLVILIILAVRHSPKLLQMLVIIGLAGCVPLLFHVMRNGVTINEPLIPFVVRSDEVLQFTRTFTVPWTNERILRFFRILYPIAITFPLQPLIYGTITPLWLGLLPTLLKERRSLSLPVVAAAVTTSIWILFVPAVREARYILPLFVVLFVPLAWVMQQQNTRSILYRFATGSAGLLLTFSILQFGFVFVQTQLQRDSTTGCLYEDCQVNEVVNQENPPPGTRVFSNARADYYLRPDMLLCNTTRMERQMLRLARPEERWTILYDLGFDYIIDSIPDEIERRTDVSQYYKENIALDPDDAPPWLTINTLYGGESEGWRVYELEASVERDRYKCIPQVSR